MAYAADQWLVRAIMRNISGLPADNVVNDFVFDGSGSGVLPDAQPAAAANLVDHFYNSTNTNGVKLGIFISRAIDRAQTHTLEVYSLAAGLPLGSPVLISPWLGPTDPPVSTGIPTECAGVLSYHASLTGVMEEVGATRPKARRRGRLFIGPLNDLAIQAGTPPYRLDSANGGFLQTLRQAAVKLMDDSEAVSGMPWCVWSRKDSTLRTVVGGWTDDAPDTMRSRGVKASARVVWGA